MLLSFVVFHLQKSIFEGIAQEALSECVKSLVSASGAIASKKVTVHHLPCFYKLSVYITVIHIAEPQIRDPLR